jgi:hypothetical protein
MRKLAKPKGSFFSRLPNGDLLNVTIWSAKSDLEAEVVTAEIRRYSSDSNWQTLGRLARYRSPEGNYKQLAESKRKLEGPQR